MGGTSFDVCLVNEGAVEVTKETEIAEHRIALPMVAVHTIGAGGGSIVTVDDRGLLRVGPDSAGADPGPACYGRGGTRPTVTDADLLVGYLDPERFWGGRLRLDESAAREAFRRDVAEPLGVDVVRAAYGAHQVVNANMVDAIREVSVRRGHDPRGFVLVAAGGAGPIHACAIARELDIGLILVPREASVMCAAGQLLSDLRHDFVRSCVMSLDRLDRDTVERHLRELRRSAEEALLAEGVPRHRIAISCAADVRYVGQFSEVGGARRGYRADGGSGGETGRRVSSDPRVVEWLQHAGGARRNRQPAGGGARAHRHRAHACPKRRRHGHDGPPEGVLRGRVSRGAGL